jgi:Cu(I)/Ag(I) efflux system membrane fusion protein
MNKTGTYFHSLFLSQKKIGLASFKIITYFLLLILFNNCSKKEKSLEDPSVWYTCSMDPQVMEKKPGKCPICKMDLTKIIIQQSKSNALHLSIEEEKLANVLTKKVSKELLESQVLLNGVVTFNENLAYQVSSRVMGRIERLHVKTPGSFVHEGEPLYDIYSMTLATNWKELARNNDPNIHVVSGMNNKEMLESIQNRLKYLGVPEHVIHLMEQNKLPGTNVPFYAPHNGYIIQISAKEGDNITAGQPLFQLIDLNHVWVEANLYPMDIEPIQAGKKVLVWVEGLEKPILGTVISLKPELKENTRVTIMRIDIPNPNFRIKPGMKAQIAIPNQKETAVKLPEEAIIESGKSATVWIKTADHTYEPRAVKLGLRTGNYVAIDSGILPEDEVVVSGTYLLNSEYTFRSKY